MGAGWQRWWRSNGIDALHAESLPREATTCGVGDYGAASVKQDGIARELLVLKIRALGSRYIDRDWRDVLGTCAS